MEIQNIETGMNLSITHYCAVHTKVRFANFQSGGFITVIVVNPPESKLAKRISVQCSVRTEK